MKNIVVIPIYKEIPNNLEIISFRQACSVFNNYKFSIICPNNLKLDYYLNILNSFGVLYQINYFDESFFAGVYSYNKLMLNVNFYKCFTDYDFMLIYQLDSYVFKDKLNYWCDKNYDYIGAPWFENYDFSNNKSSLLKDAGNGGFSLRKISSFINILNMKDYNKEELDKFISENKNEDGFFSIYAKNIDKDFKVAPPEVAMHFSFECLPERLYKMTNQKLPFGCHAWHKYNLKFWNNFINFDFSISQNLFYQIILKIKRNLIKH